MSNTRNLDVCGLQPPEPFERIMEALETIKPIADRHKASFAQTIIAWTIAQPGITAALVGARNAEQATHNAQAVRVKLSADEIEGIRKAFDTAAEAAKA